MSTERPRASRPATLRIDLDALARNYRLLRERAKLICFGQRRDEEPPTAFAQQTARDALDSEAVGVGFDDSGAFARLRTLAQHAIVARQRVEVDANGRRPRRDGPLNRHTAARRL